MKIIFQAVAEFQVESVFDPNRQNDFPNLKMVIFPFAMMSRCHKECLAFLSWVTQKGILKVGELLMIITIYGTTMSNKSIHPADQFPGRLPLARPRHPSDVLHHTVGGAILTGDGESWDSTCHNQRAHGKSELGDNPPASLQNDVLNCSFKNKQRLKDKSPNRRLLSDGTCTTRLLP